MCHKAKDGKVPALLLHRKTSSQALTYLQIQWRQSLPACKTRSLQKEQRNRYHRLGDAHYSSSGRIRTCFRMQVLLHLCSAPSVLSVDTLSCLHPNSPSAGCPGHMRGIVSRLIVINAGGILDVLRQVSRERMPCRTHDSKQRYWTEGKGGYRIKTASGDTQAHACAQA